MQRPRNNARLPGDRVIFSMFDEVFGRPVISNPDPQFARSLNDYRLMIEEGGTEPRRMFADLRDRQMNIQQELEDVRSDTTNIRYNIGMITGEIQGLRDDMGAVLTRMEEAARNYETIVQIGADITRFGNELTQLKTTMENFVSVCSSSLQQSQPPVFKEPLPLQKDNSKEVPKLAQTIAGSSRAVRFADLPASHSRSDEGAPKQSSQPHSEKKNEPQSSNAQRPIADSPASSSKSDKEAPKELRNVPKPSPTVAGSSRAVRFVDLPASHSRSDDQTPKASSQTHSEKKNEQQSSHVQRPIVNSTESSNKSDKEAPKELPKVPKHSPTIAGSSKAVRLADLPASHSRSDDQTPKASSQTHREKNNEQQSSHLRRPIADSPESPTKSDKEAPKELPKVPKHSPTIAGSSRAVRFADSPASPYESDEETPKSSSQTHREKNNEQKSSNAQKPIADSPESPNKSDKEAPKELRNVPKPSPMIAGSSKAVRFADLPASHSRSDEDASKGSSQLHREKNNEQQSSNVQRPIADSSASHSRSDKEAPKPSSQLHHKKNNEQQSSHAQRPIVNSIESSNKSDKEASKELRDVLKLSPMIASSSKTVRFADSYASYSRSDKETPKASSQTNREKKNEQESSRVQRPNVNSTESSNKSDKEAPKELPKVPKPSPTTAGSSKAVRFADLPASHSRSDEQAPKASSQLSNKVNNEQQSSYKPRRIDVSPQKSPSRKLSDDSDQSTTDEESSAEESSDGMENLGPPSSIAVQKERDEPHSSSKRKRCDSFDSRKKSKLEKPTVSTHSSSKVSDNKGRVASTSTSAPKERAGNVSKEDEEREKRESRITPLHVKQFIRSLDERAYCELQKYIHSFDPRFTYGVSLECVPLRAMQIIINGISENIVKDGAKDGLNTYRNVQQFIRSASAGCYRVMQDWIHFVCPSVPRNADLLGIPPAIMLNLINLIRKSAAKFPLDIDGNPIFPKSFSSSRASRGRDDRARRSPRDSRDRKHHSHSHRNYSGNHSSTSVRSSSHRHDRHKNK